MRNVNPAKVITVVIFSILIIAVLRDAFINGSNLN